MLHRHHLHYLLLLLVILAPLSVGAQGDNTVSLRLPQAKSVDTLLLPSREFSQEAAPARQDEPGSSSSLASADTLRSAGGRGPWHRLVNYFRNSDKTADRHRFDFGVLPGPHFSSVVGLGLGIVATGTYRTDLTDPQLRRSNVSLYGDMTTKGFFMLGIRGNNIFPHDRYRLNYKLDVSTFSTSFWGVGYDQADIDDNEHEYRRDRVESQVRFLWRIAKNLYIGPRVDYSFVRAADVKPSVAELRAAFSAEGETASDVPSEIPTDAFTAPMLPRHVREYKVGLSLTYDSRDFLLNAYRGWFLQLDQCFSPRFLWNDHPYSSTELTCSTYRQVWKGGVLCGEWHSLFTYGRPSWTQLPEIGTNSRMRGYYSGRYRDKNLMELQVELRQRIHKRIGGVVWLGAGEVFPAAEALRWNRVLPNGGVGFRWEFKHRVNLRIEYGFTRNGGGLIFSINEAF